MKALKVWVHGIARVLLVATVVIFSIPAILSVVNWIIPVPAGELGNSLQRMLASLSVLCYGVSMVPLLPSALIVLTTAISLFDIFWRKARGHRFNKKQLIFTIIVVIVGVIGHFSLDYITEVYTAVAVTL